MAINYSVNGTPITTVSQCIWQPVRTDEEYDGKFSVSEWYTHIWSVAQMTMDDFEFLDSLKGKSLLELVSSDVIVLNTQKTYTDAILSTVSGGHIGLSTNNARIEFLVKNSGI